MLFLQAGTGSVAAISNAKLFLVFFKIGAVLFGSGYVLVAYLDGEFVEKLGWLTPGCLTTSRFICKFQVFCSYRAEGQWTTFHDQCLKRSWIHLTSQFLRLHH